MSISTAFNSAGSGLAANARQAEVLSSNIANASTPGYVRREAVLAARADGGAGQGVTVDGIRRDVDLFLLNARRAGQAAAAASTQAQGYLTRLEGIQGDTESTGSLVNRVNALDGALVAAASRPESEALLSAAVTAAESLATALNQASRAIQDERLRADHDIAAAVERINTALVRIDELNTRIRVATAAGRDVSGLQDEQAALVDSIAELVPVREVAREQGTIALFTTGGAALVDGRAARLEFEPAGMMAADMTLANGALSGLSLDGIDIPVGGATGLFQGGTLAGMFALRDSIAPAAQAQVDALARDLVLRLADPGIDPTLPAGAPGLFTDAGGPYDSGNPEGIAGRIALNASVDPGSGGSVLALRDGLGTGAPGQPGDSSLLLALSGALTARRASDSPGVVSGSHSAGELAAKLLSLVSTRRVEADSEAAFHGARLAELRDAEARRGVDIDTEMQGLLVIERHYAANARVIQALDQMLASLLEI